MPFKPHLEVKIMQCFPDVGGTDAWLSGRYTDESQWWIGWHQPGPSGVAAFRCWRWPANNWHLIGFEKWTPNGDVLLEAMYNHPHPSMQKRAPKPWGHWHSWFALPNGTLVGEPQWSDCPLTITQEDLYLKGTGKSMGKGKDTGGWHPKGSQGGKGKADATGRGKGNSTGGKANKGKGKGKGKGQGKGKSDDTGKGMDNVMHG